MNPDGVDLTSFRSEVRCWIADHRATLVAERGQPGDLESEIVHTRSLVRALYDAGWMRWGWPEELGGLGGSPLLRAVVGEELVSFDLANPSVVSMIEVLGPPVAAGGDPSMVRTIFPRLLRGEEIWCQGFSEPEFGSDLASLRCKAELQDGSWVISGQKVWTSWGKWASRCLVLARTGTIESAHRGITAFFVDMDTPGITQRPLVTMSGLKDFSELFFDGVIVPSERIVGGIGGGWTVAMHVLSCERGGIFWQRAAWNLRRLAKIAEMAVGSGSSSTLASAFELVYALRARSRVTQYRAASGDRGGAATSVDKVLMAAAEQGVFDACRELLPGFLETSGADDAAEWRADYWYSRAASIYGGTAEIQRNIISERVLGLPRER